MHHLLRDLIKDTPLLVKESRKRYKKKKAQLQAGIQTHDLKSYEIF